MSKLAIIEMDSIIKCPYCGEEHDGLEYLEVEDMSGSFEMPCENEDCQETIYVEFKTVVTFASKHVMAKDTTYFVED